MARKRQPRLLKKVEKDKYLHLHNAFPKSDETKRKELTKEEEIFEVVTEVCEEHYLLTDSECGLSLIEDKGCVKAIEGTENGYVLKFRMDTCRAFAVRQFAIRLSKRLNCLRRFFVREDSVSYEGVEKPLFFLECAMVLEDNMGKEPIDRSEEEDDEEFLFEWKRKRAVCEGNVEGVKGDEGAHDGSIDADTGKEEENVDDGEADEQMYDGTQDEDEVNTMLEEAEVEEEELTEESYADADEAYANFA